MTTILIQGGRVLDGTGATALEADVLIDRDRIAGLLDRADGPAGADQRIDASGCIGLRDRGVLASGKATDVVIFDPEEIADTPPAAGQPAGGPRGIRHVFVNGRHVVRDSCFAAGSRAGRVLRA